MNIHSVVILCLNVLFTAHQDTLCLSGYTLEEAEEVIGKVISVIDSTDHFLGQTAAVLEEVCVCGAYNWCTVVYYTEVVSVVVFICAGMFVFEHYFDIVFHTLS